MIADFLTYDEPVAGVGKGDTMSQVTFMMPYQVLCNSVNAILLVKMA
jgi:hypothetical protein